MISRILCPVDGSSHAAKAAELATDLALQHGVPLHFLHVFMRSMNVNDLEAFAEHPHLREMVEAEAKRLRSSRCTAVGAATSAYIPGPCGEVVVKLAEAIVENAIGVAEQKGVSTVSSELIDGEPSAAIIKCAERIDADTIVMGSRGLGAITELFGGSVSHKVAHQCHCTCVTVK